MLPAFAYDGETVSVIKADKTHLTVYLSRLLL